MWIHAQEVKISQGEKMIKSQNVDFDFNGEIIILLFI